MFIWTTTGLPVFTLTFHHFNCRYPAYFNDLPYTLTTNANFPMVLIQDEIRRPEEERIELNAAIPLMWLFWILQGTLNMHTNSQVLFIKSHTCFVINIAQINLYKQKRSFNRQCDYLYKNIFMSKTRIRFKPGLTYCI